MRLPVIPEKVVYPGDEALCLVLSQVGRSEKLATDVGFRHGVADYADGVDDAMDEFGW